MPQTLVPVLCEKLQKLFVPQYAKNSNSLAFESRS